MIHAPVLKQEVLNIFGTHNDNTILLDGTLGNGGHAKAYLNSVSPQGRVIGLDLDPAAISEARIQLSQYVDRIEIHLASYADVDDHLKHRVNHILLDLGIGSHQLSNPGKGFSFQSKGPLTMRFGNTPATLPSAFFEPLNTLTARIGTYPDVPQLIQGLSEKDLADLIFFYGEERQSRRVAAALKKNQIAIRSAYDLARVISDATARYERRIHPATRTFQALRLAVNRELEVLQTALPRLLNHLEPDGVIIVISFHSLEDRIVKQYFRSAKTAGLIDILTKKPVQATSDEIKSNPRARSAKLRAARKRGSP